MSPRRQPPEPGELTRLRQLIAEGSVVRKRPRQVRRWPAPEEPAGWAPGEEWNAENDSEWDGDDPDDDDDDDDDDEDDDLDGHPSGWGRRWWGDDAPSGPIRVEGGLVARTRRGAIGSTWWSQRFLAAIESAMEGGRPGRGRAYARAGQVLRLTVGAGTVEAVVQGSRPDPYTVRLTMPVVDDADWAGIVDELAARAGYAARMLAGELPHELEDVFASQGCSLFPGPGARLTTACSCPDWANPCKHVAAVCYLVAESFDDDPFVLLAWRGHPREEVLAELRRRRSGAAARDGGTRRPAGTSAPDRRRPGTDALAAHIPHWWQAGGMLADVRVRPAPAPSPAAILDRTGTGSVQVGGRDLAELLGPAYEVMAAAALRRALGDG